MGSNMLKQFKYYLTELAIQLWVFQGSRLLRVLASSFFYIELGSLQKSSLSFNWLFYAVWFTNPIFWLGVFRVANALVAQSTILQSWLIQRS